VTSSAKGTFLQCHSRSSSHFCDRIFD